MKSDSCPECSRRVGLSTYSCTVPGCLSSRFCCSACICEHMAGHVRAKDARIKRLADALSLALEIICHADPDAWKNGNEAFGVDEGKEMTFRAVEECRKALVAS